MGKCHLLSRRRKINRNRPRDDIAVGMKRQELSGNNYELKHLQEKMEVKGEERKNVRKDM